MSDSRSSKATFHSIIAYYSRITSLDSHLNLEDSSRSWIRHEERAPGLIHLGLRAVVAFHGDQLVLPIDLVGQDLAVATRSSAQIWLAP